MFNLNLCVMKKQLLLLLVLPAISLALNAQTVFEDDYESYDDGTNLTSEGYAVWAGVATVVDDQVQTEESPAYSGHKYAKCIPDDNNFYLRKSITLEEGKTYTFEVVTRSPAGKNHKIAIDLGEGDGKRTVASSLVNNTTWSKVSVEVEVGSGETSAVAYVYSWPKTRVDVDDFKIYEGTATRISKNEMKSFKVFPNPSEGVFNLTGENTIKEYVVFNSAGQVVNSVSSVGNSRTSVDLSGMPKGVYLIKVTDDKGVNHMVKTMIK